MSANWLFIFMLKSVLAISPTVVAGYLLSRKQLLRSSLKQSIMVGGIGAVVLTYITQDVGVYYLALGAFLLPVALYTGDLWNIYLRGKGFRYKLFLAIVVTIFTVLMLVLGILPRSH
jgi:hypothetical protein